MTEPGRAGGFTSGPLVVRDAALFTDLYEITMAASYWRERMSEPATFSLFVRKLPAVRSFLVAAGLEDVLTYLEQFRFSPGALEYLDRLGRFEPGFLDHLARLRFSGSVRAVAEGTVVFPDEPLLEVTAPIMEAQLVETAVLNFCHFQTMLASKAARAVRAARGRAVVEFGLRRTHGVDAGLKAARCAYLAGAEASSNVLAGAWYGVPPVGTMAHSYVSAFADEEEAFRAFARAFPAATTLLLDTYDTIAGAHRAVAVARDMERSGHRLAGVRLDSGDLAALSQAVRQILDAAGLFEVKIFASGNLDEHAVDRLLAGGAPIDAFGIGTRMDVSADAPYLDMAYKLVRYGARYVLKTSPGKETWTGDKQVYRLRDARGQVSSDLLALADEPPPEAGAEALLHPVMADGQCLAPHPALHAVRDRCAAQIGSLPEDVTRLENARPVAVRYSERLTLLQRSLRASVRAEAVGPRPGSR